MTTDLIKSYQGEGEESFIKRKAYFIRLIRERIAYGEETLDLKKEFLRPITSQEKEEINDFWLRYITPQARDVLIDYEYYNFFNLVRSENEKLYDYIPHTFFYAFIDEFYTNPQRSMPCDDKNLYDLYFYDVNRPKVVFRKLNNMYLDEKYAEISLKEAIFRCRDCGEVILKTGKFTGGGDGIIFWNAEIDSEEKLLDFLKNSNNVVCQKILKQYNELNRLSPDCVDTIRMTTFLFENQVHVLSSVLRIGKAGSRTDNVNGGGMACGIKPNGQLKNFARDLCANTFLKHPNGTAFESITIPNFHECIDIATSLAKRFASISKLISWDFAIDEAGQPVLIEFNVTFAGLDVHHVCNGPILGDLTDAVLKDVFANSYTLTSILKSLK